MLASAGIDAAQLSGAIQQTNVAGTFEPLQPVYDTDIEGYLRHEHEQVILSMIEDGRRQTLDAFQQGLSTTLHRDWQAQKQQILEELGQHRTGAGDDDTDASFVLGVSLRRSVAPSGAQDDAASSATLHSRMIRYDTVVSRLNRARLDQEPLPLIHAFMETVESFVQDPARKRSLLDAWSVLKYMVRENRATGALPAPVHAREYASTYLDPSAFAGPAGVALRSKWVRGAREFLEAQFSDYMEAEIAAAPLKAERGGVPTVRATVAAFLRVELRTSQGWPGVLGHALDSASQTPLWALVFYLLRVGETREALDVVLANEDALQRSDASFVACLKAFVDSENRTLPRSLRDHLMAEYVTRFRGLPTDTQDVYQYAAYRVLGRFDVTKRFPAQLASSTENWLWLQLCMVSEVGDAQAPTLSPYTLRELGDKLEKYGEAHFDPKGHRPLHYFQLLLLVGRFEKALAFLQSRPAFHVDVVHFATALVYYGLLRVPPAEHTSQFDYLTVSDGVPCFDYAKLIKRYTRLFAQTSRRDALAYISLVCLNSDCAAPIGQEQVARCHEQVRSLILESPTSAFLELLGDVRVDGVRTPGLIEQHSALLHLGDQRDFFPRIVQSAAAQCEREQRLADAILLYNFVGERDTVVSLLNRELGRTLMEPAALADWQAPVGESAPLAAATSTVVLARAILASYSHHGGFSSAQREVCETLLGLKHAVSLQADQQLQPALQALEALHILPLDAESRKDVVSITRKAEEFSSYDENITKNFSDIVLMAMTLLYKLHEQLKSSITRSGSGVLFEYRSQARSLMMWAGMLRFRMSNETYSQLTRLDVYVRSNGRVRD